MMIVVLGFMIALPIVGALIAFDAWHCSVRRTSFDDSTSASRRA